MHYPIAIESGTDTQAFGLVVPKPQALAAHQAKRGFKGWTWSLVTVDFASLSDKAEPINITLPSLVLHLIDQTAKNGGESRSTYTARRVLE